MIFSRLCLAGTTVLFGRTAWAASSTSSASASPSSGSSSTSQEPCALVSRQYDAFMASNPRSKFAIVDPMDAERCLFSVPLDNIEDNKKLLQDIMLYMSWQPSLSYYATPPKDYTVFREDPIAGLQTIYRNLEAGMYTNEYSFQADIHRTIQKNYDFHLIFQADILGVFTFYRGYPAESVLGRRPALTSWSEDPTKLPRIYNWGDTYRSKAQRWSPSPIKTINGKLAENYLIKTGDISPYAEPGARYNAQLYNNREITPNSNFVNDLYPDGPETVVVHDNGTTITYKNYAVLSKKFSGIKNGKDFFKAFCKNEELLKKRSLTDGESDTKFLGQPLTTNELVTLQATWTKTGTENVTNGYPNPIMIHDEGVISGHYLTGQGYDDVAVLGVQSFYPTTEEGAAEFQDLVYDFLGKAKSDGKKKLVIDLRGNGGGRVVLGNDLFKQLFPSVEPWGGTTYRALPIINYLGQAISEMVKNSTYERAVSIVQGTGKNGTRADIPEWVQLLRIFNYKIPMNADAKPFSSWAEWFGPVSYHGDKFTNLDRANFSNYFSDEEDIDMSGYRTRAGHLQPQHFMADDIILLQDGLCGSTCSIFSELMKTQGKVQQIVMGGNPLTGPMQGVAGSKASQKLGFDNIYNIINTATKVVKTRKFNIPLVTEAEKYLNATMPFVRGAITGSGSFISGVSIRDAIRQGDTTHTPIEFIYEAADCKLWYTRDMMTDASLVWKATVDARWKNFQNCVTDSTKHPSSLSGGALSKSGVSASTNSTTIDSVKGKSGTVGGDASVTKVSRSSLALFAVAMLSVMATVL